MSIQKDLEQTLRAYQENASAFSSEHASPESWRPMFEKFREIQPSGRILDLGSAHCRDAQLFLASESAYGPSRYGYIGIDACKELLDLSVNKAPRVQGNILSLPFADNSFEGIWACASLLHIPKAQIGHALSEIRRVSTPQSTYFISVKAGSHERLRKGKYSTPRFFAFYQDEEFQEHLQNAKMEVLDYYLGDFDYNPPDNLTIWMCYLCRPAA